MLEAVAAWCVRQGYDASVCDRMMDWLHSNEYTLETMPSLRDVYERSL